MLSAFDPTLFDEFQRRGQWWIPETPDNKVAGVLTYKETENELDLFGYIKLMPYPGRQTVPEPTPIILGLLEDGSQCTLFRNRLTAAQHAGPSCLGNSKWSANIVFMGGHFMREEDITFQSWSLNFTDLEEWIGEIPFNGTHQPGRVEYVQPERLTIPLPSINATLDVNHVLAAIGPWFDKQSTPRHPPG